MAMLDDIATALVAQSAGQITDSSADWMIYKGYMQDGDPVAGKIADRAICLYETGGEVPEELFRLDRPGLQVRVRGKPDDYQAARQKLQDVFEALHANEVEINAGASPATDVYIYCYAIQSGPIPMGNDEKRRPHLALNFRILKERP